MNIIDWLSRPWPWYVAGPLIGLMVPLLLIMGNKAFGISSSLRHICAACVPAGIPFFNYDWKKEIWNLFFVAGIVAGGFIAGTLLASPGPSDLNPQLITELSGYGITNYQGLMPAELFSWNNLLTIKGLLLTIVGGFLVGFGTRYAGGCTSGHSIMGMSTLQLSSLIATICFMAGGFFVANLVIPIILKFL